MQYHLMALYIVCSNYVPRAKNGRTPGHIGSLKIFSSKTTQPRPFIFGMQHHLMVLYQVCSKYDPGPKMAPTQGLSDLHRVIQENIKKSSSLKPESLELIFGMYYYLMALYCKFVQNVTPGPKMDTPGLTCFSQENLKKLSILKPLSVDLSYLVWSFT